MTRTTDANAKRFSDHIQADHTTPLGLDPDAWQQLLDNLDAADQRIRDTHRRGIRPGSIDQHGREAL